MAAVALIPVVQPARAQVGIGVAGGLTTPVGSLGDVGSWHCT